MTKPRLYQLIELKLDEDLEARVERLRAAAGSWRTIARMIESETDIPVSHETLRSWFPEAGR